MRLTVSDSVYAWHGEPSTVVAHSFDLMCFGWEGGCKDRQASGETRTRDTYLGLVPESTLQREAVTVQIHGRETRG